jgi:hypothetical protein
MYRRYCKVATVVFLAFTVYPVFTKLVEHRLAHDWAHSLLHFLSALLAAYAGWYGSDLLARFYVLGVAVIYGILGTYGWFTDGFFLGTPVAIPLGPVENVFHLVLAMPAVLVLLTRGSRFGSVTA